MDAADDRPEATDVRLPAPANPRDRILNAAARLLAEGGREAVSTRAVSAIAGVQPPTIYRLFGDMRGLLDTVAADGFTRYVQAKIVRKSCEDPVEDLRTGWNAHIAFGLANPALYALMYGNPQPGARSAAAIEAYNMLKGVAQRVAEAGRLRVGVDRGARMIHAAAAGVVFALITVADAERDLAVSDLTREAILAAITTDTSPPDEPTAGVHLSRVAARAVALKAVLSEASDAFTSAERGLLVEWLDRLSGER